MSNPKPQDILRRYISDMAAAEQQLIHTLNGQQADTDLKHFVQAHELVTRILIRSEERLVRLKNLTHLYGGEPSSVLKEAVTAVTGTALGALSHLRSHNVSKILRDDYSTLSLIAVGYSMLHTTGIALDDLEIAELSLTNLREVASFIIEISQAVVPVVVSELAETNPILITATDTASANIRQAWREA